jgi:hypothetical protein
MIQGGMKRRLRCAGAFCVLLGAGCQRLGFGVDGDLLRGPAQGPESPVDEVTQDYLDGNVPYLRLVDVTTDAELDQAIADAAPGDLIRLAEGTYSNVDATTSGTATNPIILVGPRGAVLDGGDPVSSWFSARLQADHWILTGFSLTNSQEGVMIDGGNNNTVRDLEIFEVGYAGVMIFVFSSDNLVEKCRIHDTGTEQPQWGDGIVFGNDPSNWPTYTGGNPDTSDRNRAANNVIGPNVRGNPFDLKAGTTGSVVESNTIDGRGLVQDIYVNSWMLVQGNSASIIGNNAAASVRDGVEVLAYDATWGKDNVFADNAFDVKAAGWGFNVNAQARANNTIVYCSNVVTNAASGYATTACTP